MEGGGGMFYPVRKRTEWTSSSSCYCFLLSGLALNTLQLQLPFHFLYFQSLNQGRNVTFATCIKSWFRSSFSACFLYLKCEEGQTDEIHSDPLLRYCSRSAGHCHEVQGGLERAEQRQLWIIWELDTSDDSLALEAVDSCFIVSLSVVGDMSLQCLSLHGNWRQREFYPSFLTQKYSAQFFKMLPKVTLHSVMSCAGISHTLHSISSLHSVLGALCSL